MPSKYIFYLENLKPALDHLEIKVSLDYLEIKASIGYLESTSILGETLNFEAYLKNALSGYRRYAESISVLKRLSIISELIGVKVEDFDQYFEGIERPLAIGEERKFREDFAGIKRAFLKNRAAYKRKLAKLTPAQKKTLDEAMHCYFEGCYHSTTVMAISTIESRISDCIERMNRGVNLERQTLSQLIEDYLNNREYYHSVFDAHEELLRLCDRYRLLSPSPKEDGINKNKASAIIHLVFEFLFDCELKKRIRSIAEAEEAPPIYFIKG